MELKEGALGCMFPSPPGSSSPRGEFTHPHPTKVVPTFKVFCAWISRGEADFCHINDGNAAHFIFALVASHLFYCENDESQRITRSESYVVGCGVYIRPGVPGKGMRRAIITTDINGYPASILVMRCDSHAGGPGFKSPDKQSYTV